MRFYPKPLSRISLVAAFLVEGMAFAQAASPTLRIAEKERHLRAGEAVTRAVIIDGASLAGADIHLAWQAMVSSVVIQRGVSATTPVKTEEGRVKITFWVPEVKRVVTLRLIIQAQSSSAVVARLDETFRVYPADLQLPWKFMAGRRVAIFDPSETLAPILTRFGGELAEFERIGDALKANAEIIAVGSNAFRDAEEAIDFYQLLNRDNSPRPIVVFRQRFLPVPDLYKENTGGVPEETSAARICAPDHFALSMLDEADLRGWRGDGVVGKGPWIYPPRGNFRRLLLPKPPSENFALEGTILAEILRENDGPILYCQATILENWETEPAAEMLLNGLLRHALESREKLDRKGVALAGDEESALLNSLSVALWEIREENENPANSIVSRSALANLSSAPPPGVLIIDAGEASIESIMRRDPRFFDRVRQYVLKGGLVIAAQAGASALEHFDWILGDDALLEENPIAQFDAKPHPLLWGMTRSEWREIASLRATAGVDASAPCSLIPGAKIKAEELVSPGIITLFRKGQGQVIFIQPRLEEMEATKARLLWNQLITNLGVSIQESPLP